jgi:hypothetical protein
MEIDAETILSIFVAVVVVNIVFLTFYLLGVLKEIKNTVQKAGKVIDDVDRSVKDGLGRVTNMEKPLQALATTSVALAGVLRSTGIMKKATDSIISVSNQIRNGELGEKPTNPTNGEDSSKNTKNSTKAVKKPRWFKSAKK